MNKMIVLTTSLILLTVGCIDNDDSANNDFEKSMESSFQIIINCNKDFEIIVPLCINWDGTISKLFDSVEIEGEVIEQEIIDTKLDEVSCKLGYKISGTGNVTITAENHNYLPDFDEKNQTSITLSLKDKSLDGITGFPFWLYSNLSSSDPLSISMNLFFHRVDTKYVVNSAYETEINGTLSNGWQRINSTYKHISG